MSQLEPPDSHFYSAAQGWIELGLPAEAENELLRISPGNQAQPCILDLRWGLAARSEDWPKGLAISQQLLDSAPDQVTGWLHRSYSLRRLPAGGLQAAWDALWPARGKFPGEPIVHFNLACYAVQLGRLDEAWDLFQDALKAGEPKIIRQMALQDPDLEPLWERIRQAG
jgi:tetratricopeptide (TPR) repeat protein